MTHPSCVVQHVVVPDGYEIFGLYLNTKKVRGIIPQESVAFRLNDRDALPGLGGGIAANLAAIALLAQFLSADLCVTCGNDLVSPAKVVVSMRIDPSVEKITGHLRLRLYVCCGGWNRKSL